MKTILLLLALFGIPGLIAAQSIVNSKHNLSIGGPGKVKATTETEVCLFCHTPHNSKPKSPLWNRHDPGSTYTLYNSSTKKAVIGQPSGSSILCLSCHDGTVALGSVLSRVNTISFANTVNMPNGPSNLSTDLRNDHPVSFPYDGSLVKANGHLKNPASLPSNMHLENGELQCTACHDPHKNAYTDFLVMTSQNSTLCLACHEVTNWSTSIHNTSVKTWDSLASAPNPNPWKFTPWKTVADNACENCHNPHNGGATTRLLKYQTEEDNCFDCHNGHVATKNVFNEFNKPYKHNVYAYTSVHDPTESPLVNSKHVECVDCHSSHDMKTLKAAAPLVKGANSGIAGIKQDGSTANPVSYEYEICYRCHSNSAPTGPPTSRKIVQNNQRLEFDPTNPSYHPVAAIGKNTTLVDLITPYSAASQIYCSDCHASDGTNAPAGPHGSIYPQILKYNYDRTDVYFASSAAYELCYKCHEQDKITSKHDLLDRYTGISPHSVKHGEMTSCNTCHDPHGISATQGNSTNNSFLINFNTAVVSNNSSSMLQWDKTGLGTGKCNLTCHSHNHINSSY